MSELFELEKVCWPIVSSIINSKFTWSWFEHTHPQQPLYLLHLSQLKWIWWHQIGITPLTRLIYISCKRESPRERRSYHNNNNNKLTKRSTHWYQWSNNIGFKWSTLLEVSNQFDPVSRLDSCKLDCSLERMALSWFVMQKYGPNIAYLVTLIQLVCQRRRRRLAGAPKSWLRHLLRSSHCHSCWLRCAIVALVSWPVASANQAD